MMRARIVPVINNVMLKIVVNLGLLFFLKKANDIHVIIVDIQMFIKSAPI